MPETLHELRDVMSDIRLRDKMYLFLQNIFHLYPEDAFHALLVRLTAECENDKAVYHRLEVELPKIQPFLGVITHALPALRKQKKVMVEQTLRLLGARSSGHAPVRGYVEIGSIGRYISVLRRHETVEGDIVIVNDVPPSNDIGDIFERGQIRPLGRFVALDNYAPFSEDTIASESIDLVTCYIGLHHITTDRLSPFVTSIARVLRPGGTFILRDHDASTPEMVAFCSAIHTVFNVGTGVTWEDNANEVRLFQSIDAWAGYLEGQGFTCHGERLLQDHDPSDNALLRFTRGNA